MILTFGTNDLSRHEFVRWMRTVCTLPMSDRAVGEVAMVRTAFLGVRNEFSVYLPDGPQGVMRAVDDVQRALVSSLLRSFSFERATGSPPSSTHPPRWTVAVPQAFFTHGTMDERAVACALGAVAPPPGSHPLFLIFETPVGLPQLIDTLAHCMGQRARPFTSPCAPTWYAAEAGAHCNAGPQGDVAMLRPTHVDEVRALLDRATCARLTVFTTSLAQLDDLHERVATSEALGPLCEVVQLRSDYLHPQLHRANTVYLSHAADLFTASDTHPQSVLLSTVAPPRVVVSTLYMQPAGAPSSPHLPPLTAHPESDRYPSRDAVTQLATQFGYDVREHHGTDNRTLVSMELVQR